MTAQDILTAALANVQIQAMMFDMDIDYETLTLQPKKKTVEDPYWLVKFKDQRANADFDTNFDIDRDDNGR